MTPPCPTCGLLAVPGSPYHDGGLYDLRTRARMRCEAGHLFAVEVLIESNGDVVVTTVSGGL